MTIKYTWINLWLCKISAIKILFEAFLQVLKQFFTALLQSLYGFIQFEDMTTISMNFYPHGNIHKNVDVQVRLGKCED